MNRKSTIINRLAAVIALMGMALCMSLRINAQTANDVMAQMHAIKMDANYYYGESFDNDASLAYDSALQDLIVSANEARVEVGKAELAAADIIPLVKELKCQADGRVTVVVYISAKELMELENRNNAPAAVTQQQPQLQQSSVAPADDLMQILCNQDGWIEIKGILKYYKNLGKIHETGNCFTSADLPDDAYAILIDEAYGILAILSPKNQSPRINYRTNKPDSETNHPDCKIIVWYK